MKPNQNQSSDQDKLLELVGDITSSGTTNEVDILGDPFVSFEDCLIRKSKPSC